jgi:copper oxidase (laccase) domain-containing protein
MPPLTQSALTLIRPQQAWQGVQLFCTTRQGGVGELPYDTFNRGLGTQDNPDNVHENRRRLRQVLPSDPAWLKQVHGVRVVDADDPQLFDSNQGSPAADASVSTTPGRVLAVLTADCLSVVLADQDRPEQLEFFNSWIELLTPPSNKKWADSSKNACVCVVKLCYLGQVM